MLPNCSHSSGLSIRADSSPAQKVTSTHEDCSITGLSSKPRRPTTSTEATYRGTRQAIPGSPTRDLHTRGPALRLKPHKHAEEPAKVAYGGVQPATGVPNKRYRGTEQAVPGCPTNFTGVPNKFYRGTQQILPGSPTNFTGVPDKSFLKITCKKEHFLHSLSFPCYCYVYVMFNNNREDKERSGLR